MAKFTAGDIISSCTPFVSALATSEKRKRCDFCFRERWNSNNLVKCPKCKQQYYCNNDCRIAHWKDCHGYECPVLQTRLMLPLPCGHWPQGIRLLLQYALKCRHKNRKALQSNFKLYDGSTRNLTHLINHLGDFKGDKTRSGFFNFSELLTALFKADKVIAQEELEKYYAQLAINSFAINDELKETTIGTGLYVEISVFDHSCRPNAAHVFDGKQLFLRALQDIDTSNQKILVSYVSQTRPLKVRQEYLQRNYFFTCYCIACTSQHDFNYHYLNRIELAIKSLLNSSNEDRHYQLCTNYHELLKLLSEIHGRYHPILTLTLQKYVSQRIKVAASNQKWCDRIRDVTGDDLFELRQRLAAAINVTHGFSHPLFISCRRSA